MAELTGYQAQLWQAPAPFQWLLDRGLTEHTILEAQFGYVGTADRGDEKYLGAISIPYFDARDRLVTTRFRNLDPEKAAKRKYDAPHGSRGHLYGVVDTEATEVWVAEGEFDRWILKQTGRSSVGLPGANSWQRQWRWLFRNSDLVHLVLDGDAATNPDVEKGVNRIAGAIASVTDVRRVELPTTMDVTDLYLAGQLEEYL